MYLILSTSLLGSIFYILFKFLERFLKDNLKSKTYYNISKFIALIFIVPISYILSLYMPKYSSMDILNKEEVNIIQEEPIIYNNENNINDTIESEAIDITEQNYKPKIEFDIVRDIYILGLIIFIFINLVCFVKFKLSILKSNSISNYEYNQILYKTKEKLHIKRNIELLENENLYSPILVGIIKPKIVLPSKSISIEDLEFILSHELIHFKRKDLIIKLLLLFINAINFFNPLIYFLIKDIDKYCEYSCDEKVIQIHSKNNEKNYCLAILNSLSVNKNIYFSTTFACSKNNLKRRLENIMNKNKPINKLKVVLVGSIFISTCILFILIFSTNCYNKYNIFAKEEVVVRKFDEPIFIPSDRGKIDGIEIKTTTNILPEFKEEQLKPKIELKGTFIKEEPSVGDIYLDFSPRGYFNGREESSDKYIKIELENIGKHKADKNNSFDLSCTIYGRYYNKNNGKMEQIRLGRFKVPKNQKVTYVFENMPRLNDYNLGFSHKDAYAPSFNITVTTGYTLESLGVKNISNSYIEKSEPIKYTDGERLNNIPNNPSSTYKEQNGGGKRTFDLNCGFYNNLNLKLNNTTDDEYCLFVYDMSRDVYDYDLSLNSSVYKEYDIKPNSIFDETITDTLLKEYSIHIVPKVLREDYLKLKYLEEKLFEETNKSEIDIDKINSKTKKEYEKLGREYYNKYEEILQKQEGDIYYKFFNFEG